MINDELPRRLFESSRQPSVLSKDLLHREPHSRSLRDIDDQTERFADEETSCPTANDKSRTR
jgi:hypothetical protein